MIVAKQMDIRSNIKKYFDLAFNGETVHVPRIGNKNVVIISEEEYNKLNQSIRVSRYADFFTSVVRSNATIKGENLQGLKVINLEKLRIMGAFKNNWNGNQAPAFPPNLIERVSELIKQLVIQPEVFPTALQTIQLEFDNSAKEHMEIEIGMSDAFEIYIVDGNGNETYESIDNDINKINERILKFYG